MVPPHFLLAIPEHGFLVAPSLWLHVYFQALPLQHPSVARDCLTLLFWNPAPPVNSQPQISSLLLVFRTHSGVEDGLTCVDSTVRKPGCTTEEKWGELKKQQWLQTWLCVKIQHFFLAFKSFYFFPKKVETQLYIHSNLLLCQDAWLHLTKRLGLSNNQQRQLLLSKFIMWFLTYW